jgi:integrase
MTIKEKTDRRTRGDGGLTYIKSRGLWCVQIDIGKNKDGKRIRKSFTGKTKQEALKKRKAFEQSGGAKEALESERQGKGEKHHFGEFLDNYIRVFKLNIVSDRTFAWYRDMSKRIVNEFGDMPIENLCNESIQLFLSDMSKNLSERTVKGTKNLMNQAFKYAVKKKVIPYNPMDDGVFVPKNRQSNKKEMALSEEVCRKVMDAVRKSSTYKPMIIFMFYTGLRIGEVLALRWENIDRENMVVNIENGVTSKMEFDEITLKTISRRSVIGDTKTHGSQRVVPIMPEILELLDEWSDCSKVQQEKAQKKGNGDLIFPNKFGDVRSYSGLRRQFGRFLEKNDLGGEGIRFHRFRHTYATFLLELGTNARVLQELLGHRHIETTLGTYITPRAGAKNSEVAKLSAKFNDVCDGVSA